MFAARLLLAAILAQPPATAGPLGPPWQCELRLHSDGSLWLVARATVELTGSSTICVDLSGSGADPASALLLSTDSASASIGPRIRQGKVVSWRVKGRGKAKLVLLAKASGYKVTRSYTLTFNPPNLLWQCSISLSVPKDLRWHPSTLVADGERIPLSLAPGALCTLGLWSDEVPGARLQLRFDPRDLGDQVRQVLVVPRPLEHPFGRRFLHAGDAEVLVDGRSYKCRIPNTPPGREVEIALNEVPAVHAVRTRATSRQVNVRLDIHRRMAAYDEQVDYEWQVSSALDRPVDLVIVEHPARGWQMVRCSAKWRAVDAETFDITVTIKPGETAKVTAQIVRRNLRPAP